MTNPVLDNFFLGRALAEAGREKASELLTQALSELGKFDAEQRENLRQFTTIIMERAQQQAKSAAGDGTGSEGKNGDLQETLDDLRAEIARMRAELRRYQSENEADS
jgi:hypothetical protein